MAEPEAGRVGFAERLGYGVGELACAWQLNFFGFFLLFFYVDLGGVAPAAIGLMLFLTKLVDAVTDPMMGAIADRTRTRWGRYRPYLLWGAIPFGITSAAVFAAPELGPAALLVYAIVTYSAAKLAYTAVNVPYSALLGVISPSSRERTTVTAYRMIFSALSGVTIGLFATTLVRELGGGDEARGIFLTMCCIAVIGTGILLTTFATTKERIPPAPARSSLRGDFKVLVRSPAWIALAIASTLAPLAIAARSGSALFFFRYVAGDDGTPVFLFLDRVALFYTALALGQVAGVVAGNLLQRRIEKRNLLIAAGALKVTALLIFSALPLDAVWPQTGVQLIVGFAFGIMLVLSFSMFTDLAEYIDWKNDRQMTGLVVSASIFAVKAGVAFGLGIPGFVLQLTGFEAGAVQSDTAKLGIILAFGIIPAIAIIPAGIAMFFYPLSRATIAQAESELAARRAAGRKAGA